MFDQPTSQSSGSSFMSGLNPTLEKEMGIVGSGGASGLPATPTAPAPPPMFGANSGPGRKPGKKAPTSFMSGAMQPVGDQLGKNTLLGQ